MASSEVRDNELAAARGALGAGIQAAAYFQLVLEMPVLGLFTPAAVLLTRTSRWLGQRVARTRSARMPRRFFLVVAGPDVAALDLRFRSGVEVRAVLWRFPRSSLRVERRGTCLQIALPDGRSLLVEPLALDADAAGVVDRLLAAP